MKNKTWIRISLVIIMAVIIPGSMRGATILIPDGDFSTTGSVSGLTSHTDVAIGSSPWFGTNTGILTLLPPSLTLSGGAANINGLLGANVLGVISNTSGSIFQTLPTTYTANTTYTFLADLTFSGLLDVNLISNNSAGITLTSSTGTILASSTIPSNIISLSALNSSEEQVSISYTTGSTVPTGGIGLTLFANPTQALSISAGSNVAFSNLSLTSAPAPENSSLVLLGVGVLFLWGTVARNSRLAKNN